VFFSKKIKDNQNWVALKEKNQLDELLESSKITPVLLFKHSTRCSISTMALNRLNQGLNWSLKCNFCYLDLLSFRILSNQIANISKVEHQSPQAILIHKNNVLYSESHGAINANEINELIKNIEQ
tara:strand:- start:278 stop:652 length:375 start_codon:yes stop_codon:yes gene_type:complete